MADKNLNLYQKLAEIRKRVEVVRKNKDGYNYKYVTDDELLSKLSGAMDKNGVSLIPSIVPGTFAIQPHTYSKVKFNKATKQSYEEKVTEVIVSADMLFRWVNTADPDEHIDITWAMVGQQADASQSLGSALTYAYRYFLLKYFGVATPDDDPDSWRAKQREADMAEERSIAASIVASIDDFIKSYLRENPKDKEKLLSVVNKYVSDGNYFAIQESALAAKLLEELNNTFGTKE